MHVHAASAASGKRRQVAFGLRFRQRSQARRRCTQQRDVLQLVGRDHQEHAVVGAALLELARGMQVARPDLHARDHAEFRRCRMADELERLATPLARERHEHVEREVVTRLDAPEQSRERLFQTACALQRLPQPHLDLAHVDAAEGFLHEIRRHMPIAQDVEHRRLRRRHIGLVERAHAHEIAAHGDGVFPHHEVFGQLMHAFDAIAHARDGAVEISHRHLEVLALVPQVGLGLVHHDGAVAPVDVERQGVDLDVGQDALAFLAQAFGHELLDPQAQNAPALGGEEAELIASCLVVVEQESRQLNGRVVDGVLAALELGVSRMRHELAQIDAGKRRGHEPEHGKRAETPAHRGLSVEHGQPALFAGLGFEGAARIGDRYQMPCQLMLRHVLGKLLADRLQHEPRLDGPTAFRRRDHERAAGFARCDELADAHGRIGIGDAERHLPRVYLVVLRDGHGSLGRTALADEDDRIDAHVTRLKGEILDLLGRIRRVRGQIGPAHEIGRAFLCGFGKPIERGVLGMQPARNLFFHQRLRRRIELVEICAQHRCPFFQLYIQNSEARWLRCPLSYQTVKFTVPAPSSARTRACGTRESCPRNRRA